MYFLCSKEIYHSLAARDSPQMVCGEIYFGWLRRAPLGGTLSRNLSIGEVWPKNFSTEPPESGELVKSQENLGAVRSNIGHFLPDFCPWTGIRQLSQESSASYSHGSSPARKLIREGPRTHWMWLLNSKEPVPHTLGTTGFVTRPVGERIQLAFRRGAGANLQLYQHLDTQSSLNIQDFEEQPNALLASIHAWKSGKVWPQVLTTKRLERAKNAGKCVVIPTCVCPTSSVPADAFLIKYRVWRHLGRHQHSLRSHGRTNFEKNSPGAQHPWQTVPKTAQFHGT